MSDFNRKIDPPDTGESLVTFLLDKSGSMADILDQTIESFNGYVDGLRDVAGLAFTLVTFDTVEMRKVCVREPVKDAPKLDKSNYVPGAGTPLIEAAHKTILAVERGAKAGTRVVVAILTDGEENSSAPQYTWDRLKELVARKTAEGWEFLFMGAGIDAYQQAAAMGVATQNTVSYDKSSKVRTEAVFAASSSNTRSFLAGMSANASYSGAQKADAGDAFDPVVGQVFAPVPVRVTMPGSTMVPGISSALSVDLGGADFSL